MGFRRSDEFTSAEKSFASVSTAVHLPTSGRALSQRSIAMGALALSMFLLALLGVADPAQALVGGEDFEPGQVIVKLNPTIGASIEEINADYGLTTLDKLPGGDGIYLLKTPAGSETQGVVGRLVDDARLLYAEPKLRRVKTSRKRSPSRRLSRCPCPPARGCGCPRALSARTG